MTVREFYKALCALIPRELGCEWDKDGMSVCPDPDREVRRVLVALDAPAAVVDQAIAEGYDLIFTHHPMLWGGLKAVCADDHDGAKVIGLCRAGISAVAFHTRIDAAEGGVNDKLALLVGLENVEVVGDERIMRVGTLAEPIPAAEFAARVKDVLGAPAVLCADAGKKVHRVAVVGGSGKSEVALAIASGADTFLTGELKYSQYCDTDKLNLLVAGHFYTERHICPRLCALAVKVAPDARADTFNSCKITII